MILSKNFIQQLLDNFFKKGINRCKKFVLWALAAGFRNCSVAVNATSIVPAFGSISTSRKPEQHGRRRQFAPPCNSYVPAISRVLRLSSEADTAHSLYVAGSADDPRGVCKRPARARPCRVRDVYCQEGAFVPSGDGGRSVGTFAHRSKARRSRAGRPRARRPKARRPRARQTEGPPIERPAIAPGRSATSGQSRHNLAGGPCFGSRRPSVTSRRVPHA